MYDENAKILIESCDEISKYEKIHLLSSVQDKIHSWDRGYRRSSFYRKGRSKSEYFDFKINELIVNYLHNNRAVSLESLGGLEAIIEMG